MKKFSFMSKIKLNKAPKKMYLLKQLVLLMATAFILVFAVFAWFLGGDGTAEATGMQVTMTAGESLQISLNGGAKFLSGIDLTNPDPIYQETYISPENSIMNLYMRDITSDGLTFYRPVFKDDNSSTNRIPDTTADWDFAGNNSYISVDIVFRTSSPSEIHLGEDTTFLTSAEGNNKLLVSENDTEIGNKSDFGKFSNDCIIGALRLSAVNSNNELVYVYVPRKDIEMTKTIENGETQYSVIVNDKGDPASHNSALHKYFRSTGNSSVKYEETTSENSTGLLGIYSDPIATTTLQENNFYEATATINIWLEGCDPETTRALSKGQYSISLDFVTTPVD